MAKKKGGQRKHWAQSARAWAWYNQVRRWSGLSDYELDHQFAWREDWRHERSNDCRPRMFEWLRKRAREPAGRDPRWRSMSELVGAVEGYPGLSGTRALYEADVWNLMQRDTYHPDELLKYVENLLAENSLVQMPVSRVLDPERPLPSDYDDAAVYDRCLTLSLRRMNRYDGLALIWALYLLTEPAHNWMFRAKLESRADEMLDRFFADYLGDDHLMYYSKAIQSLLAARIDLKARRFGGYGYIETVGQWVVVPADMVGKVNENHLMSAMEIIVAISLERDSVKDPSINL